jgi:ribosomal protein S18 acetylase RimI-like enzyme
MGGVTRAGRRTSAVTIARMSLFAPYEPRDPSDAPRPSLPAGLVIRMATRDDAPALARRIAEREGGEFARHLEKVQVELARDDIGRRRVLIVAILGGGGGGGGGEVVGFGRIAYCVPAADAPPNAAPPGWYLGGVIVGPAHRRVGIGRELTRWRLAWLRERGVTEAWFVVNADNRASIDLHAALGFHEVTRNFVQPGVVFSGRGEGILFRLELGRGREGRDAPGL